MYEKQIETVGRLIPREQVRSIGAMVSAAGIDMGEEFSSGLLVIFIVAVLLVSFIALVILRISPLLSLLGAIVIDIVAIGLLYQCINP